MLEGEVIPTNNFSAMELWKRLFSLKVLCKSEQFPALAHMLSLSHTCILFFFFPFNKGNHLLASLTQTGKGN